MDWLERHRTPVVVVLLAIIAAGIVVFIYRQVSLPDSTEIVIEPPPPEIHAYVEGEVASPGVYQLRDGDLVENAIEAAGGFTADADRTAVNLACRVRDGDHVHVYRLGDVPQKININTAEAWLLQALPGIGESLARRIVEYRTENGPFQQIENLKQVEGIGPATFENLKDKITVR